MIVSLPEHLQGCPAKRGLPGCVRDCGGNTFYPDEVCGLVYAKYGKTPPPIPPKTSDSYRGREERLETLTVDKQISNNFDK